VSSIEEVRLDGHSGASGKMVEEPGSDGRAGVVGVEARMNNKGLTSSASIEDSPPGVDGGDTGRLFDEPRCDSSADVVGAESVRSNEGLIRSANMEDGHHEANSGELGRLTSRGMRAGQILSKIALLMFTVERLAGWSMSWKVTAGQMP
jgi:hypothetical protein